MPSSSLFPVPVQFLLSTFCSLPSALCFPLHLLVPYRLDRGEARGAEGGVGAEGETDRNGDGRGHQPRLPGEGGEDHCFGFRAHHRGHAEGTGQAGDNAYHATHSTDSDGFGEKL